MSAIAWPLLVMALGVTGIGVTLWRNQARPRRLPDPASALELEELEEILEVSAGTLRIPEGGAVSLAESVYEEIAEIVVAWSDPAEQAQQSLAKRREVQALELDVDLGGGD
jgi:hypothetical protein